MKLSITNILAVLLIKSFNAQAAKKAALADKLEASRVYAWERAAQLEIEANQERSASKGFYAQKLVAEGKAAQLADRAWRVKEFLM